jgi:hypothetical protein
VLGSWPIRPQENEDDQLDLDRYGRYGHYRNLWHYRNVYGDFARTERTDVHVE